MMRAKSNPIVKTNAQMPAMPWMYCALAWSDAATFPIESEPPNRGNARKAASRDEDMGRDGTKTGTVRRAASRIHIRRATA